MKADCHEIIPGLYLGSEFALIRASYLREQGVTHLLSVNGFSKQVDGFVLKTIYIDDEESEDIAQYFEECIDYIRQAPKVFVFCTAGRSRSVSVVCAYLMKVHNMNLKEALRCIGKVRSVKPNRGFMRQLEEWESKVVCPLCKMEKLTHWFEETDKYVIVECEQCDFPMIVFKEHTMNPSHEDKEMLKRALTEVANKVFAGKRWQIDTVQRTVFKHLHWHARPVLFDFKL